MNPYIVLTNMITDCLKMKKIKKERNKNNRIRNRNEKHCSTFEE
jgi:hypothetical protein